MGIARIDRPTTEGRDRASGGFMPDGDGYLLVALVAGSWAATLALGWIIWRLVTL